MTIIIPFISQLPNNEQQQWLDKLNTLLTSATVKPVDDLSSSEKQSCEFAIVANPEPEQLYLFPQLKWVHSLWAGVERLVEDLKASPFEIVRLVDPQLALTMAESALTWSLFIHRDMHLYAKQQKNKIWQQLPVKLAKQTTIGVLGQGEMGAACTHLLKAHGFTVKGWSQHEKQVSGINRYFGGNGLTEMLPQCDILLCLLPLTSKTRGIVNKINLSLLPKGASVINFSRGAIVNSPDLLDSLNDQHLAYAVLDVFEREPLPINSELWRHPSIIILPHISAPTNIESASVIVVNNINHYLKTGQYPSLVDKKKGY